MTLWLEATEKKTFVELGCCTTKAHLCAREGRGSARRLLPFDLPLTHLHLAMLFFLVCTNACVRQ